MTETILQWPQTTICSVGPPRPGPTRCYSSSRPSWQHLATGRKVIDTPPLCIPLVFCAREMYRIVRK